MYYLQMFLILLASFFVNQCLNLEYKKWPICSGLLAGALYSFYYWWSYAFRPAEERPVNELSVIWELAVHRMSDRVCTERCWHKTRGMSKGIYSYSLLTCSGSAPRWFTFLCKYFLSEAFTLWRVSSLLFRWQRPRGFFPNYPGCW